MRPTQSLDWMISVDDHVLEPPHLWQERVPAKYREVAPRLARDHLGEAWFYEDKRVNTLGLAVHAAADRREEFGPNPITYDEMRSGCYDPISRLDDMNRAGILAMMNFPSFRRFCGQVFYEAKDRDLALVCVKAYNDWMIEEWCGSAPGRYIPLIIVPLWDPRLAAAEVHRCSALGVHAMSFSENPEKLGLPSVSSASGHWDLLWRACEETDTVVCMHIGSSSHVYKMSEDASLAMTDSWSGYVGASGAMLEWLFSPVFGKFPRLKIAMSEGGIGWMPFFLERAALTAKKWRTMSSKLNKRLDLETMTLTDTGGAALDLSEFDPYQRFREHVYGCFIEDEFGIKNLDLIGGDNVMLESDYPHADSSWPNTIELARAQLGDVAASTAYKIMRGNAENLFHFTPTGPPVL